VVDHIDDCDLGPTLDRAVITIGDSINVFDGALTDVSVMKTAIRADSITMISRETLQIWFLYALLVLVYLISQVAESYSSCRHAFPNSPGGLS